LSTAPPLVLFLPLPLPYSCPSPAPPPNVKGYEELKGYEVLKDNEEMIKCLKNFFLSFRNQKIKWYPFVWCHDTQHNNTQNNGIQRDYILHDDNNDNLM